MNKQNIVLIIGMSGIGKTTAMNTLEDMGYHCTNNFLAQLLGSPREITNAGPDPRYSDIALAMTVIDYPKFLQYFKNIDVNVRVILLDVSNEKPLLRYRFTGCHHPMMMSSKANTLEEVTEVERDVFSALNKRTVLHVDMTAVDQHGLKSVLVEKLSLSNKSTSSISFISFGFKHGVPMDVDLAFNVKSLPDLYYIEKLCEQAGDDTPAYDYAMSFDQAKEFIRHLKSFLDYMFVQYKNGKKNHLTMEIGYIGGHHRSVPITNWLHSHYRG